MTYLTTLIIPGYHGSGDEHWQTWIEQRIDGAKRVEQDWDKPILAYWAQNIRRAIDAADGAVWLIAHSFGCLASVAASADRFGKIAGLMLVAPANTSRFTPGGVIQEESDNRHESVHDLLPASILPFATLLIASTDDPWMPHAEARRVAESWGSRFISIGAAGHINAASGYGPWPEGLQIFRQLQESVNPDDLENSAPRGATLRGRSGYLARIRHVTRRHFGY